MHIVPRATVALAQMSGTPGVVSAELPEAFKDIQKDKAK
jgi:hypothetical protein